MYKPTSPHLKILLAAYGGWVNDAGAISKQIFLLGTERGSFMRKSLFAVLFLVVCPLLMAQQAMTRPTSSQVSEPQAVLTQPSSQPQVTPPTPTEKPRVFITNSQSWAVMSSAGGGNGSFAAESYGGARPQTAEIIKTFGQRCPEVIVNDRPNFADYIVVLDHEGGKGLLRHKDKVAVFERVSGDVVVSRSTLSLGGSVEDACKGIEQHWSTHRAELLAAREKALQSSALPVAPAALPPPQPQQRVQAAVAIASTPPGADIEIDGAFVGDTPSTIDLTPGSHEVTVKKKGYADWSRKLNVTGGSINLDATLQAAPAH